MRDIDLPRKTVASFIFAQLDTVDRSPTAT